MNNDKHAGSDAVASENEKRNLVIPTPRIAIFSSSYRWTGIAILLYGTLAAAIFAFFLYPSQHLVASTIDLNGFGALARSVAEGHGFSFGFGPTMRRAPLYPFLGAGFIKAFGSGALGSPDTIAYRPMLAANCLIFGLTCLTIWATARRLYGSRVAIFAALICPLVPQAIRYVGMTEVETIMGLFTALLVYTGLNLIQRPNVITGALFGLTAAAATLTKPVTEFYPFLFLILVWWFWHTQKPGPMRVLFSRTRVAATVSVLACFILALVPWTLRNMSVTNSHFISISSDGPGSVLRGHVNIQSKYYLLRKGFDDNGTWEIEANAYEESILRQHGLPFYRYNVDSRGKATVVPPIPRGMTSAQTEALQERVETAEVERLIFHQPISLLHQFVIQFALFWYLGTTRSNSIAVGGIALIVLVLAVFGFVRGRREGAIIWPIIAIVLYMNVVYAGTLALGRYSAPLFPTLLVLSIGGVSFLASRFRVRSPSRTHGDVLTAARAPQESAP